MFFPYHYVVTSVNISGIESVYSNQTTAAVPSPWSHRHNKRLQQWRFSRLNFASARCDVFSGTQW
jgi:hypothetical protein